MGVRLSSVTAQLVIILMAATSVAAEKLPEQLIFAPMPIPPTNGEISTQLTLEFQLYRLPDRRRAEDIFLRAWFQAGERHTLNLELHYVGIEDEERINYGGGPVGLTWSWMVLDGEFFGIGSDVISQLPLGDATFHPLSAKASTVEWRIRARIPTGERLDIWGGWWTRRVSPPTERTVPLSYYPSGSGWMAVAALRLGRAEITATARHDLAGLPSLTWLGGAVRIDLAGDLSFEFGVDGQPLESDHSKRLFETGFRAAIHHRPRPIPD